MRKLVGLCLSLFFVMVVTSVVWAANDKTVKVCHICPTFGTFELGDGRVLFRGNVYEVPKKDKKEHQQHGDQLLEDSATVGACCAFIVDAKGKIRPWVD